MEVGESPTNVLSINDLSSIHYNYLIPSTPSSDSIHTILQTIQASLRSRDGIFSVCDNLDKPGLWLFGISEQSDPDSLLPSVTISPGGKVEVNGVVLIISAKGTYEPNSAARSRALGLIAQNSQNSSHASSMSLVSPAEGQARALQGSNLKAVQTNLKLGAGSHVQSHTNGTSTDTTNANSPPQPSARQLHERFISAVLSSLVYHLCRDSGYLPLNARTLVVPHLGSSSIIPVLKSSAAGDALTLVTLDVHITSMGSLVVKAHTKSVTGLQYVVDTSLQEQTAVSLEAHQNVYLACFGSSAQYVGAQSDDETHYVISPNQESFNQSDRARRFISRRSMKQWKEQCQVWLENAGLDFEQINSKGWLMIQLGHERSTSDTKTDIKSNAPSAISTTTSLIAWPTALCFQRTRLASFQEMFGSPGENGAPMLIDHHDPLTFAEQWFTSQPNRESMIKKRQGEQSAGDTTAKLANAESDTKAMQSSGQSPFTLRRASLAGTMYPTPPDAVLNQVGATPTFDGTVSTPGQPPVPVAVPETETVQQLQQPKEDSSDDKPEEHPWEEPAAEPDQEECGLVLVGNEDDLFGDAGGDMFGETITDADFSFFDEPDLADPILDINEPREIADIKQAVEQDGDAMKIDSIKKEHVGNNSTTEHSQQAHLPLKSAVTEQAAQTAQSESMPEKAPPPLVIEIPQDRNSPFDQNAVWKRLQPLQTNLLTSNPTSQSHLARENMRRESIFEAVKFSPSLSSVMEKYDRDGLFQFISNVKSARTPISPIIPKTHYLTQRLKSKPDEIRFVSSRSKKQMEELDSSGSQSDAESSSPSNLVSGRSDDDYSSDSSDAMPLKAKTGVKRKREANGSGEDVSSPFEDMSVKQMESVQQNHYAQSISVPLKAPDPAEWSLVPFVTYPQSSYTISGASDEDYIGIAQILAQQAMSGIMNIDGIGLPKYHQSTTSGQIDNALVVQTVQRDFSKAAKACLEKVGECQLKSYLEIQDLPAIGQPNRLAPRFAPNSQRPGGSDPTKCFNLCSLAPPHLEIRRNDIKLGVSPSAIPFWETLGLAPALESKDVLAIGIYFDFDGMAGSVSNFLDKVQGAYESFRLGSHSRYTADEVKDGLYPIDMANAAQTSVLGRQMILSSIKEAISGLLPILLATDAEMLNIILYFVYPTDDPELLLHICSAFHSLTEMFEYTLFQESGDLNVELVLQLVPFDFVTSADSLVVPTPSEYARLAMQVYDRCTEHYSRRRQPSILLETPLPRVIDFKLTPNPSSSTLEENTIFHIAYAQSTSLRWLTATWTTPIGAFQFSTSYCLGGRKPPTNASSSAPPPTFNPEMSFSSVAAEIWETTLDIVMTKKIHWRVMITKLGVMERSEIDTWKQLAVAEERASVSLTLLTVDTEPSLRIMQPKAKVSLGIGATASTSTPPSTSKEAILSPEATTLSTSNPTRDTFPSTPITSSVSQTPLGRSHATASTPGNTTSGTDPLQAQPVDPSAYISDVTDTVYAAILSHRLNNSNSLLEFYPALISGYLINTFATENQLLGAAAAANANAKSIMEVNVIFSEVNPRGWEALLREVLTSFRGLATLARARGVVGDGRRGGGGAFGGAAQGDGDVRPWHVVTAERAVAALELLL